MNTTFTVHVGNEQTIQRRCSIYTVVVTLTMYYIVYTKGEKIILGTAFPESYRGQCARRLAGRDMRDAWHRSASLAGGWEGSSNSERILDQVFDPALHRRSGSVSTKKSMYKPLKINVTCLLAGNAHLYLRVFGQIFSCVHGCHSNKPQYPLWKAY